MLPFPLPARAPVLAEAQKTSELASTATTLDLYIDSLQAEPIHAARQISVIGRKRFAEAAPHDRRRKDCEAAAPSFPHIDRPNHWPGRVVCVQCEGERQGQGRLGMCTRQWLVDDADFHSLTRTSPTNSSLPLSRLPPRSSSVRSALPRPTRARSSTSKSLATRTRLSPCPRRPSATPPSPRSTTFLKPIPNRLPRSYRSSSRLLLSPRSRYFSVSGPPWAQTPTT
jgi:hypothetical protein